MEETESVTGFWSFSGLLKIQHLNSGDKKTLNEKYIFEKTSCIANYVINKSFNDNYYESE